MRIASLLPALTELVAYLGHEHDLVGVSHECDVPTSVSRLPRLTHSRIDSDASSAIIDTLVAQRADGLYELDRVQLAAVAPDLILTQAQCDVCAVSEASVRDAAATLPGAPRVLSVNPTCLADVRRMFMEVGSSLGDDAVSRAHTWICDLDESAAALRSATSDRTRPRVMLLEWLDPPFSAGHWNPELIELAGGREVLGKPGARSERHSWSEVAAAAPEVVIVAPCGFTLDRTERELATLTARPEWASLPAVRAGRVVVADGNAYFSRPGPRLLESLAIAAQAIWPGLERLQAVSGLPGWRVLSA